MVAVLVVLFLLTPVVEIYVIVQVGQQVGVLPTLALLIAESALGAWLVKREGRRAWDSLRSALRTGRRPAGELADAALVLVGGTLLLTPGFVTDVAGFFLILPLTRPLARRGLGWLIARQAASVVGSRLGATGAGWPGPVGGRTSPAGRGPVVPGEVVEGEVVDGDEDRA